MADPKKLTLDQRRDRATAQLMSMVTLATLAGDLSWLYDELLLAAEGIVALESRIPQGGGQS